MAKNSPKNILPSTSSTSSFTSSFTSFTSSSLLTASKSRPTSPTTSTLFPSLSLSLSSPAPGPKPSPSSPTYSSSTFRPSSTAPSPPCPSSSFSSFSSPRNYLESLAYPSMTPMEISPMSYVLTRPNYHTTNDEDHHFDEDNHTHKINSIRDEIGINDLNNNHNCRHNNHNNSPYNDLNINNNCLYNNYNDNTNIGHDGDHIIFNLTNNSNIANRENCWKILFDPSGNE